LVNLNACGIELRHSQLKLSRMSLQGRAKSTQWISIRVLQ
jgi:hypothetical protein